MIWCFNCSNFDWLIWHVCVTTCFQDKLPYFFNKKSTINEISGKLFEQSILDFVNKTKKDDRTYVIDTSCWNFKSNIYKSFLEAIATRCDKKVILISTEVLDVKDSLFAKLQIKISKVWKPYLDSKIKVIDFWLTKYKLQTISSDVRDYLYQQLPFDYFFINCEIQKLALLSKSQKLDIKVLKENLITLSEDNIFAIIQLWLNEQYDQCISLIEKFINLGNNIITIMHIFSTQLFRIKMYLFALHKTKWNAKKITDYLDLSIYQQKQFSAFNSQNILEKIDKNLLKLYILDVDIKVKKILPFPAFVQILLDN